MEQARKQGAGYHVDDAEYNEQDKKIKKQTNAVLTNTAHLAEDGGGGEGGKKWNLRLYTG